MNAALVIVDIQNDFCLNGALPVPDGDAVVAVANRLMRQFRPCVLTQDWHPVGHMSFASTYGALPYTRIGKGQDTRILWPDHCVAGSHGADFHPLLETARASIVLRKGSNPELDSYSAFVESDGATHTGLDGWMKGLGLDTIVVAGLATDYCVKATALDARSLGFNVIIARDGVRGVNAMPGDSDRVLGELEHAGCRILDSEEIQP